MINNSIPLFHFLIHKMIPPLPLQPPPQQLQQQLSLHLPIHTQSYNTNTIITITTLPILFPISQTKTTTIISKIKANLYHLNHHLLPTLTMTMMISILKKKRKKMNTALQQAVEMVVLQIMTLMTMIIRVMQMKRQEMNCPILLNINMVSLIRVLNLPMNIPIKNIMKMVMISKRKKISIISNPLTMMITTMMMRTTKMKKMTKMFVKHIPKMVAKFIPI